LAFCVSLAFGSAVARADTTASGSIQVLGESNGLVQLSVSVTPGSGACEMIGGSNDCDWYAYVDVEPAAGSNCELYYSCDDSGTLSSQTDDDPQSEQSYLDAQVVTGMRVLTLRDADLSHSSTTVLAQQPYTFEAPTRPSATSPEPARDRIATPACACAGR
jgi:hypothetical protein